MISLKRKDPLDIFVLMSYDVKTQDVYQSTNPPNRIIYKENFAKQLDIIYMCAHQQ